MPTSLLGLAVAVDGAELDPRSERGELERSAPVLRPRPPARARVERVEHHQRVCLRVRHVIALRFADSGPIRNLRLFLHDGFRFFNLFQFGLALKCAFFVISIV